MGSIWILASEHRAKTVNGKSKWVISRRRVFDLLSCRVARSFSIDRNSRWSFSSRSQLYRIVSLVISCFIYVVSRKGTKDDACRMRIDRRKIFHKERERENSWFEKLNEAPFEILSQREHSSLYLLLRERFVLCSTNTRYAFVRHNSRIRPPDIVAYSWIKIKSARALSASPSFFFLQRSYKSVPFTNDSLRCFERIGRIYNLRSTESRASIISSLIMLLLTVTACLVITVQAGCPMRPTAEQTSASRTTGDGGYRILVSGKADKYIPNAVYTISLQGNHHFTPKWYLRFNLNNLTLSLQITLVDFTRTSRFLFRINASCLIYFWDEK